MEFGTYSASISLLLGTVALAFAALQPQNNSAQAGFLMSGVGIWAIASGIQALRRHGSARSTSAVIARLGIVFGAVGTLVAYTLAAFFLISAGIQLPALPWAHFMKYPTSSSGLPLGYALPEPDNGQLGATSGADAGALPAGNTVQDAGQALAPDPLTADERAEHDAVMASVDSVATLMGFHALSSGTWPETLAVTTDGLTVLLPTGEVLASLPPGATLSYALTADRSNYTLTITGALYASAVHYSSESGVISWQE